MKTVETYVTEDGMTFDNQAEAERHEKELETVNSLPWLTRHVLNLTSRCADEQERMCIGLSRLIEAIDAVRTPVHEMLTHVPLDSKFLDPKVMPRVENECKSLPELARETQEHLLEARWLACSIEWLNRFDGYVKFTYRDIDGTCKYMASQDTPCGEPTVGGTRFCKKHIDAWCDSCFRKHLYADGPCRHCREYGKPRD